MYILNNAGEITEPCATPIFDLKEAFPSLIVVLEYIALMRSMLSLFMTLFNLLNSMSMINGVVCA